MSRNQDAKKGAVRLLSLMTFILYQRLTEARVALAEVEENNTRYYLGTTSGPRVPRYDETVAPKPMYSWVLDFNQSDHYGGKKSKACVPITIETAWSIYRQAVILPIVNTDNPTSLILFKNSSFYQSVNTGVLDGNLLIQALYKKDIVKKGHGMTMSEAIKHSNHGFELAQQTSSLRGTGHEILRKCIQCIFKSDHFKEYKQIYMPVTYGHEFHPESNQSLNGHAVLIIFERDPDRLVFINSGRGNRRGMLIVASNYGNLNEFCRTIIPPTKYLDNNGRQRISVFVLGITPTMNLDKRYDTAKFTVREPLRIEGAIFTGLDSTKNYGGQMVGDEGSEAMCNFRHSFIAEKASTSKNIAEQASTSKK
uniref:Uncharacterized protein n=1 Tax=Acrobeloides nanus TaxID=290746 RepID=A0A914ELM2_9BILA